MPKRNSSESVEPQEIPVCEKCGNLKIEEEGEWVCPHCQGEIDFLAGDED